MDELDEIIKEFLVESYENLDQLDRDLVLLEDAPDDRNRLSSVFRTIHTIKGTCGFLGFPILEHVTHVGESLLVRLRDGELRLDPVITTGLLAMVDAVRLMLSNIARTNTEGEDQYEALIEQLERLRVGQVPQPVASVAVAEHAGPGEIGDANSMSAEVTGRMPMPRGNQCELGDADSLSTEERTLATVDNLEALVADLAESPRKGSTARKSPKPRVTKSKAAAQTKTATRNGLSKPKADVRKLPRSPTRKSTAPAVEIKTNDNRLLRTGIVEIPPQQTPLAQTSKAATAAPVVELHSGAAFPSTVEFPAVESTDKTQVVAETTVRLDVTLLDKLMNLVGELVLVRNQILQYSISTDDALLNAASQRLNLITTELQEGVMKTRMQPIQNAWAKLPRVVRDLSMTCGKKVQIKMEGAETELDKTILEAIRDPLTHIVRNSVDHGIETPDVRQAKGKPVEGTLLLRAFHEGGQVNIEISDDGGGINLARVKEKALSQGLISAEQVASMSERELMNLILLPGFSTAATVTNVSGRGVGMDVVKTNVEKIGGTLEIHSVYGQGTTLRIKIPLTLAIVPALMITCGGERYAIPQNNLVELLRVEGERVRREIEHIHSVPVYRLRGNLLPLLYLDEQLQLRPTRSAAEMGDEPVVNIVVLSADGRQFGLVVDEINDTQEIVVKPLGAHLKEISTYAGVTIMGDGTAALILDVLGLAKRGGVVSETRDRSKTAHDTKKDGGTDAKQSLLLMGLGDEQRLAIPLSLVARLEEISISSIERANGQPVVQYGGQIMPLMHLGELMSLRISSADTLSMRIAGADAGQMLQVVVYSENGRSVGLVVDRILDIVETSAAIQHAGRRLGVLGSAVIQNRVTDLLDIHNLIVATDNDFFAPTALAI